MLAVLALPEQAALLSWLALWVALLLPAQAQDTLVVLYPLGSHLHLHCKLGLVW